MPRVIDVNTKELIGLTKKLERAGKYALPNAVRNTLNNVAFDAKKKHIPQEAKNSFTQRNPSFYKRFSRVEMAKGTNINRMASKAGMIGGLGGSKQAGDNQEQQQKGGKISGRTLIPMDTARVGGNNNRNVTRKNRIGAIKVVANSKNSRGNSVKKRFIQTVIQTVKKSGSGSVMQHTNSSGKTFLYRVERGGKINTREGKFRVTPLYSVEQGRKVKINKGIPFTFRAGFRSAKRTDHYFKRNAERQLKRMK